MAFELNPLAVLNADLLRAVVAAPGGATSTQLAEAIGKDRSNTRRALASLTDAGLVCESEGERALTNAGQDQLAAIDRAQNPTAGIGVTSAYHGDLVPDPEQPRKDFTSAKAVEKLKEMRDSLIRRGRVIQPLEVRPMEGEPGRFWITDGERRWRGAGLAMDAGAWSRGQPLPITIQDTDGKETRLSQLTANMVRADMHPLEEADAFADLIDNHAMTTAEIAREIGKTQKLVQNRLRLRQLSADDRARMSLPEDHPDHLVYKAALKSLMTPREQADEGGDDFTVGVDLSLSPDRAGEALIELGESGSPQTVTPVDSSETFERTLHDREALILIEVADKAERDPDPDLGSEHYTGCQGVGSQGMASPLIARGLVGFRQRGQLAFVRPRLFSSPYGQWLDDIGFNADRAALLFERRARVHGEAVAAKLAQDGLYATSWLNPAGDPPTLSNGAAPSASGLGAALASEQLDDQPALIEETAEERAARQDAERETAARGRDQETAYRFAEEMVRAMAEARAGAKQFGDVFASDTCSPDDFVQSAFGALAVADGPLAGAALAHLMRRAGAMGALGALRSIMIPTVPDTMMFARVAQSRPLDDDDHAQAEPDPVEDFIQAELPEGEDEHETSEAPAAEAPPVPAVPIRKSIHPDYIVCLEDGRRFKSLKRHLRTRYDLSPEEYIARWGLPRDYPMVAPNYAKARADLARQMGLREPV